MHKKIVLVVIVVILTAGNVRTSLVFYSDLKSELSSLRISLTESQKSLVLDARNFEIYTVREGDTLSEIADRFDISPNFLQHINSLTSTIEINQVLLIPPSNAVLIEIESDTELHKLAIKYETNELIIMLYNPQVDFSDQNWSAEVTDLWLPNVTPPLPTN